MTPATVHLALELVAGSEPIKGSLAEPHGERRAFEGWMELAATLEAFIESEPQRPPSADRAVTERTEDSEPPSSSRRLLK